MSTPRSAPPLSTKKRVHPVDEVLPLPKLATYGFQHVVAFYAGAVLVPIIIAGAIDLPADQLVKLITADLFTCGIASIIQAVTTWLGSNKIADPNIILGIIFIVFVLLVPKGIQPRLADWLRSLSAWRGSSGKLT